jgi:hypothetical protein
VKERREEDSCNAGIMPRLSPEHSERFGLGALASCGGAVPSSIVAAMLKRSLLLALAVTVLAACAPTGVDMTINPDGKYDFGMTRGSGRLLRLRHADDERRQAPDARGARLRHLRPPLLFTRDTPRPDVPHLRDIVAGHDMSA